MSSTREGKGDGALLYVITSFHLKLTRDVLEDNVKIALQNARTVGIAATHVLLEGDKDELFARIDDKLAEQAARLLSEGKLVISGIDRRPTYFDIFSYANTLGSGYVAIANSDILFPVETVERISASGLKPAKASFALTRWNVTSNGIYIQGMAPSPPWPEIGVAGMRRHEQNFFSYDAYVFRAPIAVPPDTASVLIGSLGCDTTLGAILKASGYTVANPAFTLRIAHFDAKPRSYRSPSSIADLDRNVDALCSAFRRPEAGLPDSVKGLLDENGVLGRGRIWFGHPEVGKFGRALQRAIGATAWSAGTAPTALKFRKIKLDRSDIQSGSFDLKGLIEEIERDYIFIEWELTGYDFEVHAIDALLDSSYRDETQAIKQYPWQAFQAPHRMSADDFRLYDDVLVIFRRTLMPTVSIDGPAVMLSEEAAVSLGSRMAALMMGDLEDGSMGPPKNAGPTPLILMIDPDALSGQGHYLPYDLQLRKAAAAKSIETSFLMNRKMDQGLLPQGMKTHRLLDAHSWEIASRGIENPAGDSFVRSLTTAIREEKSAHPDRPLIIYMYCGSFEHARLVQEAMAKFDGVGAVIHLFWLSVDAYKSEEYLNAWAHFAAVVAKDPRIRLTVATENIQAVLRAKTGAYFDVAPHPSTTFEDNADVSHWPVRKLGEGVMPVVLFPGAMREEKGFLTAMDSVRQLTTGSGFKFKCVVAGRARPDTPVALADALAAARNALVSVESGAMADEQFVDFMASGDVVVLPYKASAFADRPSGILIDAITLGRPVVAIEGTWLADAVRRFGWGEVAADDSASLAKAITKVVISNHVYVDAVRTSREGYIQQNSWAKLVKSIVSSVRPGANHVTTGIRVVSYERADRISVDETGVVAHLLASRLGRRHVMLDVGAHIGTSTAFFHKLGWVSHCFEPDPVNRQQLHATYGEVETVLIDPRAVSDRPATGVAFYKSDESTGISALHAFRDTHREANIVDVTTIADYVQLRGITKVDFLKIDVEGFDLSVLKGVPWDQLKPDVIECEYEDAKTVRLGHTWEDIAKFLQGQGYTVYISEWHPIVRYGIQHEWRRVTPYPGRAIPPESWGNILAFRMDPGYAAVREAFDACLERRDAPVAAITAPTAPVAPTAPTPAVSQDAALLKPDDLQRFKNIHAGKRCFVMGNGPSINKTDLSKLDGEIVFGCNSVFLLFDRIKWRPSYFTCVDSRVLPDRAVEISAMLRDNPTIQAFLPTELHDHIADVLAPTRQVISPRPNIAYFREQWNSDEFLPFSMFSTDINEHIIQPYTVAITMLQIAMYMGFSEIYLVGCDTSYTIPPDVQKEGMTEKGEIGLGLTSTQDNDPNHFDPRYFGKGRKWHDPQVDKMIEHYRYAKQVSELKGKTKIYNATVGGNLEVFERAEFNSLFAPRSVPRAGQAAIVQNGRDSYIRAVQVPIQSQVPVQSGYASASGSLGGGVMASMQPRPLTIFSVGAKPTNGAGVEQMAVAATIEMQPPAPAIQATVRLTEEAKPSFKPEVAPQAPPPQGSSAGAPDLGRWIKSHVLRKRAAQAVIAVVIGLLIGGGFLLAMPEQGDLRPMLVAITSLVLLGAGGLYFAYRTLGLAQRLSAENATLQQRLLETSGLVAALQRETRGESQRQATTVGAIATRIEKSVVTSLQAVDQRISQLDAALQSELARLKDVQAKAQAGVAQELGATNSRLSDANARAEKLVGDLQQLKELHSATRSALDRVGQQQGDTAQGLGEAVEQLRQVAGRTDTLGAQGQVMARAQSGLVADIASLKLKATDVWQELDEIGGRHARLTEDFVVSSEHLQGLTGKTNDLVAGVGELKEEQSRTKAGIGALNAQAAGASEAIEIIRKQQADFAQNTAAIEATAASEAQHLSQLAERIAFVDDFAKALGGAVETLTGDLGRHAAEARVGLDAAGERVRQAELRLEAAGDHLRTHEITLTNLVKGVASAEASGAAEVAALQAGISAVDAKASDELAAMGRHVADVAALSQELAGEVSTLLNELGQRIGGVDDRLRSSECAVSGLAVALASVKADGAEEVTALEKRIAASESMAVNHAEKVGQRAEELGQRVSLVEAAGAREMAELEKALAAVENRASNRLAEVGRRVADVASLSQEANLEVARSLGEIGLRLSAVDVRIETSETALGDLAEKVGQKAEELGQRVSLVEAAGAREMATLEKAIAAVENRASDQLAEVGRRVADVASLSQQTNLEVARSLGEIGLRLSAVDVRIDTSETALGDLTQAVAFSEAAGAAEVASLHKQIADVDDIRLRLSGTAERLAAAEARLVEFAQVKRDLADLTDLSSQISAEYARIDGRISAAAVSVSLMDGRLLSAEKTLSGKVEQTDFAELEALGRQVAIEAASWAQRAALLESRERALSEALAGAETAGAQEVAALKTSLKAITAALAGAETAGAQEVGKLERSISALSARSVDELGAIKSRLEATSADIAGVRAHIADGIRSNLADLEQKLSATSNQLADLSPRFAEVDSRLIRESKERQRQISETGAEFAAAIAAQAEAGEAVALTVSSLGEAVKRIEGEANTAMVDNAALYQRFNRKLLPSHIQTLETEWVRKLSVPVPRMAFGYMAARAAEVERELDGRLAASIEDVLLRTLVARATKGGSIRVLEIGTLFGTGAAIMFDALKNHYRKLHFTLLDPLDGYYSDGRADILTGQPVTEAVVRRNLAKAGMEDDQVRLITRLSTDPEAISEASDGLYDVLVIDADHSYAGVKSDFENYARLVRLGGHVIFDDYGSEDWPDVKAYVDAEMPDADFLTPVGSSWRTAVYRVVRSPEAATAPRRRAAATKPAGTVSKRAGARKKS